jgi:hypothetical protein
VRGEPTVVAEHRAHPGLAEHELGAFVGVVGVDRDVGGTRGEHGQDRDVQLGGAGGDPDADAVADPDAASVRRRRVASTSSASLR